MSLSLPLKLIICKTRRIGVAVESCAPRGADDVFVALQHELMLRNLRQWVEVVSGPCFGYCTQGPNVRFVGREMYHGVTLKTLNVICEDIIKALAEQGITPDHTENGSSILPPI